MTLNSSRFSNVSNIMWFMNFLTEKLNMSQFYQPYLTSKYFLLFSAQLSPCLNQYIRKTEKKPIVCETPAIMLPSAVEERPACGNVLIVRKWESTHLYLKCIFCIDHFVVCFYRKRWNRLHEGSSC